PVHEKLSCACRDDRYCQDPDILAVPPSWHSTPASHLGFAPVSCWDLQFRKKDELLQLPGCCQQTAFTVGVPWEPLQAEIPEAVLAHSWYASLLCKVFLLWNPRGQPQGILAVHPPTAPCICVRQAPSPPCIHSQGAAVDTGVTAEATENLLADWYRPTNVPLGSCSLQEQAWKLERTEIAAVV
ncbi:hypothetical protein H8959_007787, partial [Pygathrix nigripes]